MDMWLQVVGQGRGRIGVLLRQVELGHVARDVDGRELGRGVGGEVVERVFKHESRRM